ncbi:hypothetical protein J1N35_037787 [Gossypium stocksii]|uniref:Uncharacterized protein n=1 Tax=Gossypium stocksii TaxID=47602 RepID=A0A9D3UKY9_9ROSI|nr:hypothetical protein J1N35_037787 [Gossypium stocksii]
MAHGCRHQPIHYIDYDGQKDQCWKHYFLRSPPLLSEDAGALNFPSLNTALYQRMKKLLLEPQEEDDDGEEHTVEKQATKQEEEVEKIKSVHVKSEKEDDDVTQATTPTETTTMSTTAPMAKQELAIYQLIYDLMKSNTDDEEEVPINQLKQKRYKQTVGKSDQDGASEIERKQRYKRATKKSTQPK